ncbi:hypothetical protein [Longirhabdus pacifica]|uniref:hypothetical protein n=1 Tax=Longirhabdus pacifica TaxID=2305227 RepID=UPI001008DE9B|nr:hypothetical protein [Longirhabdus pacifica]
MKNLTISKGVYAMLFICMVVLLSSCTEQEVTDTEDKNIIDHEEETTEVNETNEIQSISLDSTDYSDLEFLKDVLKDKRIVMLGESSHGVSEYNLDCQQKARQLF